MAELALRMCSRVEFKRRRDAEVAMAATVLNGKTLAIAWHTPA